MSNVPDVIAKTLRALAAQAGTRPDRVWAQFHIEGYVAGWFRNTQEARHALAERYLDLMEICPPLAEACALEAERCEQEAAKLLPAAMAEPAPEEGDNTWL